jgi:general secretion pathway protein I
VEVVVALVVFSTSIISIGALVASSVRGTRALEQHVALVETSRAIRTGLPNREQLNAGVMSGDIAGHEWRVDVRPFPVNVGDRPAQWVPLRVVMKVRSPTGSMMEIETVRLQKRAPP